jgi:hypothetical protein
MQSKNTRGIAQILLSQNTTKATNAMEELERKNKGGGQPMTSRSRSNGFPSLRGGIDWWSCRSRSPFPKSLKNMQESLEGREREQAQEGQQWR